METEIWTVTMRVEPRSGVNTEHYIEALLNSPSISNVSAKRDLAAERREQRRKEKAANVKRLLRIYEENHK